MSARQAAEMNFAQLRDALLALDPLNKEHVIAVNKAEAEYWAARIKPGTVRYEIAGVNEELAKTLHGNWNIPAMIMTEPVPEHEFAGLGHQALIEMLQHRRGVHITVAEIKASRLKELLKTTDIKFLRKIG